MRIPDCFFQACFSAIFVSSEFPSHENQKTKVSWETTTLTSIDCQLLRTEASKWNSDCLDLTNELLNYSKWQTQAKLHTKTLTEWVFWYFLFADDEKTPQKDHDDKVQN